MSAKHARDSTGSEKRFHSVARTIAVTGLAVFAIWLCYELWQPSASKGQGNLLTVNELDPDMESLGGASPDPLPDGLSQKKRVPVGNREGKITVKARLLDHKGSPIPGGFVGVVAVLTNEFPSLVSIVSALQGQPGLGLPQDEVQVDADGMATFSLDVQAIRLHVYGRAPGMGVTSVVLQSPDGTGDFDAGDLVLSAGGAVTISTVAESSDPLRDVTVAVWPTGEQSAEQLPYQVLFSGENGQVIFNHLNSGKYLVQARLAGFVPSPKISVNVSPGEHKELKVSLNRGGKITGIVLEANGKPASKIKVTLFNPIESSPYGDLFGLTGRIPNSTTTDPAGRFSLMGIAKGIGYRIRAERSKEYGITSEEVYAGKFVTLQLPGKHKVIGRVLISQGNPAAGARIKIYPVGNRRLLNRMRPLEAKSNGEFSLELFPGQYNLVVWHKLGEHVFDHEFAVEEDTNLGDLFVPRGGNLEINITALASGESIQGATIKEVLSKDQVNGRLKQASGDADQIIIAIQEELKGFEDLRMLKAGRPQVTNLGNGEYLWEGLTVGSHKFKVLAEGHAQIEFSAIIQEGQVSRRTLRLAESSNLNLLVVREDGSPVQRLSTELYPLGGEMLADAPIVKSTGQDGRVTFKDLSPKPYRVREGIAIYGFEQGSELGVINLVPGDNEAEIVLKNKVSPIVVIYDLSGPISGAEVRIFSGDRFQFQVVIGGASYANTDEAGRLNLPPMRPGSYKVVANRIGGIQTELEVDILDREQEIEIELSGLGISGRVLGTTTQRSVVLVELPEPEMRGHWLRLKNCIPPGILNELVSVRKVTAECDQDGNFWFWDLPAGDFLLTATASGYSQLVGKKVSLIDESAHGVELEVVPSGALTLRVTGLSRGFSAPLVAQVVDYDGVAQSSSIFITDNLDFTISDSPLGGHLLRIYSLHSLGREAIAEFPVYFGEGKPVLVEWNASGTL
jgi:hypothetical protein